jgi:hypothetical protein
MYHPKSPLARAIPLLFAALAPVSAQQWIQVSPDEAASHLIKKVEPVYPVFAKAARVQGTVSLHIGIGLTGRIGALMEMNGPPCLYQAAQDAVLQYVYKPFEKDGRPVPVDTTVTVVFKLEGNAPLPPPPPDILGSFKFFERAERSNGRYAGYKCVDCLVNIPPEFRKWLAADLKKQIDHLEDGSESSPEFLSLEAELQNLEVPLPATIEVIEVPIQKAGTHLYLFRPHIVGGALCGATGNCSIELIEENASDIRTVVESFGGGYSIHAHSGSPYPDIFVYSHMAAGLANVAGYVNVDGLWGQVYCGEITWSGDNLREEKDDIHVCR